jgi:hypothetical protein
VSWCKFRFTKFWRGCLSNLHRICQKASENRFTDTEIRNHCTQADSHVWIA